MRPLLLLGLAGCADLIGIQDNQQTLVIDSITPSTGALVPTFDPAVTSYDLPLAFGDDIVELRATSNDPVAEVVIDERPGTAVPVQVALPVGDTTVEIVGRSPAGVEATYQVTIHRPDLAVAFSAPLTIDLPTGMISQVDIAEFDGSGGPDLGYVTMTGDIGILTNNGAGGLVPRGQMQFGGGRSFATRDVDHDGKPDLIVNANQLWVAHGHGDGFFDAGFSPCPSGNVASSAFANIDAEPSVDLVVSDTTGIVRVCTGSPAGGFSPIPGYDQSMGPDGLVVVAGSIDPMPGDDLVSLDIAQRTLKLHHNTGTGFQVQPLTIAAGAQPVEVALFDLEGDGALEVVWIDRATDSVVVTDSVGTVKTSRHVDGHPRSLTIADIDGDGHADVTVLTDIGLGILHNDGRGLALKTVPLQLPGVTHIALGDFDRDGHVDLATANFTSRISIQMGKP